jgi:uncharacterized protein with NRDE domain
MCLIAFSFKQHPRYDLIFIANRDEFYSRATRGAQFWTEHPSVLAGKDLEAEGTWMGITRGGSFAALTNYRDMNNIKSQAPSRGSLVLDYLVQDSDPRPYLLEVNRRAPIYNGFNLLAGNPNEVWYYSNRERIVRRLPSGAYGLSNHLLNTPWPKVQHARDALKELTEEDRLTEEELFSILENDRRAKDESLPITGLSLDLERAMSPVFIQTEEYGTRSSTVLLIDKDGHVTFTERVYKPGTNDIQSINRFEFDLHG